MATKSTKELYEEIEEAKHQELLAKVSKGYDNIATHAPPRKVNLPGLTPEAAGLKPKEGSGEAGQAQQVPQMATIRDALENSADLTDMQMALSMLFPKEEKINYGSLMVARVSPNVFYPGLHMSAVDEIMMTNHKEKVDVNKKIMKHYTIWSIGLDSDGRFDVAEIAGAAREEKRIRNALGGASSGL